VQPELRSTVSALPAEPSCHRWTVDAVAVDGHQIAFIHAGQGLPVILLGGFVGDALATWHHQIQALSDTNAVLAWDAPGSGGSSDAGVLPPAGLR
jgi:pimeloyl-ACP methyl ester carboxylesterase